MTRGAHRSTTKLRPFVASLVAIVLLAATALLAVTTTGASAAVIPGAITNVTLSTTTPAEQTHVETDIAFAIPNGTPAGDTFSLTLPSQLAALPPSFTVTDPNNVVILNAVIVQDPATKLYTVTFTTTNYAQTHSNVQGTAFFTSDFDSQQAPPNVTTTWTYSTATQTWNIPVTPVQVPPSDADYTKPAKLGSFTNADEGRTVAADALHWQVDTQTGPFDSASITDTALPGQIIDCATVKVVKGTPVPGTNYDLSNRTTVVPTSLTCNGNSITVTFPALGANLVYEVQFDSSLDQPTGSASKTAFNNTASVTTTTNGTNSSGNPSSGVVQGGAGGSGNGDAVSIDKFSAADGPVAGAFDSAPGKSVPANTAVPVKMTIRNTGVNALTNLVVTDATSSGPALQNLSCDFSAFGGPSTGTTWAGPLPAGSLFQCTGTVPGMPSGTQETDVATVTGTGNAQVTDNNPFNSFTPPATTPTVSTTISEQTGTVGDTLNDSVTISGLGATNASTVQWALLGPVNAVNGSCTGVGWTGAPTLEQGSVPVSGDGTFLITSTKPTPGAGCYTYQDTLASTGSTTAVALPAGLASETALIQLGTAGVTTTISAPTAHSGDQVQDAVQITGIGGASTTYTWQLRGPVLPVSGSCAAVAVGDWTAAPVADLGSVTVSGAGTYHTLASTYGVPGCYSYAGSLPATATTGAVNLLPGDPQETALVTARAPQVSTTTSAASGHPGLVLHDSINVTNTGGASTTYTWQLVGPMPAINGSCGISWTNAPVEAQGTLTINGDGVYPTSDHAVTSAGCYSYRGTLAATATTSVQSLGAGVPAETTFVAADVPTVTTKASSKTGNPGGQISDTVTVSGMGVATATLSWELLGPVAPVSGSCAGLDWTGAHIVASGTISITGDKDYAAPAATFGNPGCYTYRDTLPATASTTAAVVLAGDPAETALVTARTITLSTAASAQSGRPGLVVHDGITVTGGGGAALTANWTLLGPVPAVNNSCVRAVWTGALTEAMGSVTINADGTVPTADHTLTVPGCYSYADVIPATPTTLAASLGAGDPAETILIAPNAPTVTTTVSEQTGRPADSVHDRIVVSGMGAATADYQWQLRGPLTPVNGGCSGLAWGTAPVEAAGTVAISGDGTYATTDHTVAVAGCYTYDGTLPATTTTLGATLPAGVPAETVNIAAYVPSIATTTSASTGVPGDSVQDTVVVTGTAGATATLSWQLRGPVEPVNGSCVGVTSWANAGVVATGTIAVSGDGTYHTSSSTFGLPGCYSYQDSLPATSTTAAVTVAAGDPAETSLVSPHQASVVTTASVQTGHPGDSVQDSVVVSGTGGAAATLTWQLRGPVAPVNGSCAGLDWGGAAVVDHGSIAVSHDGTYHTGASTFGLPGCYSYSDALPATPTSTGAIVAAGVPAETALISARVPVVSTTVSSQSAKVGDTVSDTVHVTGTGGAASTIAWQLRGPMAPVNGSCTRVVWTSAAVLAHGTINVTGDGTYRTPESTFTADGCYTYADVLAATPTTAAVALVAGDPNETTKVRPLISALTLHKLVKQAANSASYLDADQSDKLTGVYGIGETITWRIVVKNTGEAALTDVRVTDPSTPDCVATIPSLKPGETASYDCTSTAQGNLVNVATASDAKHKLSSSDSARIQVSDDAAAQMRLAYTGAAQLPLTLAGGLGLLVVGFILVLAASRKRFSKNES